MCVCGWGRSPESNENALAPGPPGWRCGPLRTRGGSPSPQPRSPRGRTPCPARGGPYRCPSTPSRERRWPQGRCSPLARRASRLWVSPNQSRRKSVSYAVLGGWREGTGGWSWPRLRRELQPQRGAINTGVLIARARRCARCPRLSVAGSGHRAETGCCFLGLRVKGKWLLNKKGRRAKVGAASR